MKNVTRPALLVLIRHAESERNRARKEKGFFVDDAARRRVQGIPDHRVPLTPRGRRQARAIGPHLRTRFGVPDYIYDSGYRRTIETREGILAAYTAAERRRIQLRSNPFIRERHAGYTYDMTKREADAHFPFLPEYWNTFGRFIAEPPGGESLVSVLQRVFLFNSMLFRDRAGQKVFVVAHGGTIACFRYLLEHWDYEQGLRLGGAPENASITVYARNRQGRLRLREYNTVYWR